MEQITRERWLEALLSLQQGGRLNQLLSVMSGGDLQYVEWLEPGHFAALDGEGQAEVLGQRLAQEQLDSCWPQPEHWQGAGLLHMQGGGKGLMVVSAFAAIEDFQQETLARQLRWLQQMQQQNGFPVRLLLLAFAKEPDCAQEQPGMLEHWQWEEVLETGLQMAIGQQAALAEVLILPMVAYRRWLQPESC